MSWTLGRAIGKERLSGGVGLVSPPFRAGASLVQSRWELHSLRARTPTTASAFVRDMSALLTSALIIGQNSLGGAGQYRLEHDREPPTDQENAAQSAHLDRLYSTRYRRSARRLRRQIRRRSDSILREPLDFETLMLAPTALLTLEQQAQRDLAYCAEAVEHITATALLRRK